MIRDDLREPDKLKKIAELVSAGMSWEGIRKKFITEYGIEANVITFKNAYSTYSARAAEIIAGDDELKGNLRSAVINTSDVLVEVNTRIMNILRKNNDELAISAAREITRQLELQQKLLNHISEGFSIDKVNKIEYTKISINNLSELEKAGYIRVIRKPGEPYDPQVKEVVELDQEQLKDLISKGSVLTKMYNVVNKDFEEKKEGELVGHNNNNPENGG